MRRCAFLSTDNLEDFFVYDRLLFEPMRDIGWECSEVSWRKQDIDWDQFEVVVIRSTWDYQADAGAFIQCLEKIESSNARLVNSLALVKWNINKRYLADLARQSVPIVPTLWAEQFEPSVLDKAFSNFHSGQLIIKPQISANADHTYRLTANTDVTSEFANLFAQRPFMLQPFLPAIISEGEYSLFYFAGDYSHCIIKRPKAQDFRVQEEHGGQLALIPATDSQLAIAEQALAALPEPAFYARVDLVKHQEEYVVMEIELIEPSLYFNMDAESPARFANAFKKVFG